MTLNTDKYVKIDKRTLIRVYKMLKEQPKKIFVTKEIFPGSSRILKDRYLQTLIVLNVIEEVPVIYMFGRYHKSKRTVRGYRLTQQIQCQK